MIHLTGGAADEVVPFFMSKPATVKVESVGRFLYNGRQLKAGEVLEVSEDEADEMVATEQVRRLPEAKRGQYKRRDLRAEEN